MIQISTEGQKSLPLRSSTGFISNNGNAGAGVRGPAQDQLGGERGRRLYNVCSSDGRSTPMMGREVFSFEKQPELVGSGTT